MGIIKKSMAPFTTLGELSQAYCGVSCYDVNFFGFHFSKSHIIFYKRGQQVYGV